MRLLVELLFGGVLESELYAPVDSNRTWSWCWCFCQRGENRASVFRVFGIHAFSELATHAHATSLLGLGGVGWGMLTFVRTCDTRACYVTSWVGWGGVGDVDVRENLRHMRMLRHFLGWVGWGGGCWRSWEPATHAHATSLLGLGAVGWGMLTFVRTCDTCACYVTSWVGCGGVGDVDVRENLRHMRITSLLGWGGGCWRSWERESSASRKESKTKRPWFTQVEWIQCGGCLNQQFLVALRPGWTATSILNWCEASEFGNGVGWTPKKMFWRKLVACWTSACASEREKNRASFQHKNPCNLQAMMLKPLDFPRENSRIFEMKVNSFAMAKTTFFQKRSKRWRGFPPDGMFLMMILQQSVFNVPHPVNTRSLVVSQNRQQTNLRSWVKKKTKGKRCVSKIFSTYWKEHTSNPNHPPFFLFEYSILLFCGWWCKWDTPLED